MPGNLSSAAAPRSSADRLLGDATSSVDQCMRNHNVAPYDNPPQCFVRFERDTSATRYCSDGGCGVAKAAAALVGTRLMEPCDESAAQSAATWGGAAFFTMGGAPAPIPCSRVTVHQDTSIGGQACLPADEVTPINEVMVNYLYADFHAPMYQTSSCCSSIARLGFRYDAVGMQYAQIHNPFARSPLVVMCDVGRRSVRGNTCEADFASCEGDACWSTFYGVGACGVGQYRADTPGEEATIGNLDLFDYDGSQKSGLVATLDSLTGLATHPYCQASTAQTACDATQAQWQGFGNGGSCDEGAEGTCDTASLDFWSKCRLGRGCPTLGAQPALTSATHNVMSTYPLPPLDDEQKGQCQGCRALVRALHAFPCSGRQGEFVQGGQFRICKSACERLYDTCGPPTHRGGFLVMAGFLSQGDSADPTPRFAADYNDATSMCEGLWAPHPQSVWAAESINLSVVDDADGNCVGFERTLGSFSFDTQSFVFDYQAIRKREGYCKTADPLFDAAAPCGDLEEEKSAAQSGRRLQSGAGTASTPMFSLDDIQRSKKIASGWPYEGGGGASDTLVIGASVGGGALAVLAAIGLYCLCNKRKGHGGSYSDAPAVAKSGSSNAA